MNSPQTDPNRYQQIIEAIFFGSYQEGQNEIPFEREEIVSAAEQLGLEPIKNVGDLIYALRYRISLPQSIVDTQPPGMEWIIEGAGRAKYVLRLVKISRILPNSNLVAIKIPDATPEIIGAYSLSDEQALLAKVRYNRLLDVFLGITVYSLQNHLRTSVTGLGQVEIDEIYVGVDRHGCQYVVPVQAKGGADQLSVVQTQQDLRCCQEKFAGLVCRAISAQFITDNLIAIFELDLDEGEVRVVEERHYRLVPAVEISQENLESYRKRRD